MEQNFKNHVRFSPLFHFFSIPVSLFSIGASIFAFTKTQDLTHGLIIIAFILITFALLISRLSSLTVQNRAIKTEENLRYFILTNKLLPKELKLDQIIALRFASDEEFLSLIERSIAENLSSKEIKMAIKNWKADYNRV